jgi:hypothetical protein
LSLAHTVDQDKEVSKRLLSELGYGPFGVLRPSFLFSRISILFIATALFLNLWYLLSGQVPRKNTQDPPDTPKFGTVLGRELYQRHESFVAFIRAHGTLAEEALYQDFAETAVLAAHSYDSSVINNPDNVSKHYHDSSFTNMYLGVLFFWVQIVFLAVASWRYWLLGALGGAIYGFYRLQLHKGDDLMGVLSNGTLFHSGLWIGLDRLTDSGEPDVVAPGLACPRLVAESEVDASPFRSLLDQYQANCPTNRRLVSYILAEKDFPAWVSRRGVEPIIERTYPNVPLYKHAYYILEKALVLQALYKQRIAEGGSLTGDMELSIERIPGPNHVISTQDYADFLVYCFHQALTPRLRVALAKFSESELACIILSSQAGLLLTYEQEVGSTYSVVSCFPELNARAMMHSVPTFSRDFSFPRREKMRRALVYSARSSLFELNRLPTDMSEETLAARQLVELSLTPPHLLPEVGPDVELYALAREAHEAWKSHFVEEISGERAGVVREGSFIGPGEVLFMPLNKFMSIVREVVPASTLERLRDLSEQASLYREGIKARKEDVPPHLNHLLPPSDEDFVASLVRDHDITEQDALDWLGFRYVLRSYSWLAQRIGDKANGAAQIIFLIRERQKVYKTDSEDEPIKRISEFSGGAGVVPLRTTQITEQLGQGWYKGMGEPKRIHVPLTRADFDKLVGSGTPKRTNKHNDDVISARDEARGNVRRIPLRAI